MVKHVLIAGAGMAGPALSLSLAHQGIRSTIFEIRSGPSFAGGSLTLASHAIKVRDTPIGIYNELKEAGYSYRRMGAYSHDGYRYGDILVGNDNIQGYAALRIMRHKLQKMLLDACTQFDDMVTVKWGFQSVKINESDQAVTVTLSNGSKLEVDVLIGCDGIHSRVRDYVLPDNAPGATFFGQCTVNDFLPASSITLPEDMPSTFVLFTSSGILMVVPVDNAGETLAWGITTDTIERDRDEWRAYEVSGQVARDAKAMFADVTSQPLRSILDNADDAQAKIWPHHSLSDLPKWHHGRVCLIGDAAHALSPNGQGTAMAFEDAAYLSRLLSIDPSPRQDYTRLFAQFERVRRKRVDDIKRAAKPSSSIKSKSGSWAWWLKQWAFWVFFTWHRGQIQFGRDETYDVMTQSVDVERCMVQVIRRGFVRICASRLG